MGSKFVAISLPVADAAAFNLAIARIVAHGVFLVSALTTSYRAIGYLPTELMRPPGIMLFLSWKFYDRLVTPNGMALLQIVTVLSLMLSCAGFWTVVTTKSSAALVILFDGIVGSFGHTFAGTTVAIYCLVVLAFTPCGDRLSIDALIKGPRLLVRMAYAYPLLLMQMIIAWSYFASGFNKLRVSGLEYFSADNLAVLAIRQSLHNLHPSQYTVAFWLPKFPALCIVMAVTVTIWELTFPLAIVSRRLRPFYLVVGVVFHLMSILLMNLYFTSQLAMYVVFVDWHALWSRMAAKVNFASSERIAPNDQSIVGAVEAVASPVEPALAGSNVR